MRRLIPAALLAAVIFCAILPPPAQAWERATLRFDIQDPNKAEANIKILMAKTDPRMEILAKHGGVSLWFRTKDPVDYIHEFRFIDENPFEIKNSVRRFKKLWATKNTLEAKKMLRELIWAEVYLKDYEKLAYEAATEGGVVYSEKTGRPVPITNLTAKLEEGIHTLAIPSYGFAHTPTYDLLIGFTLENISEEYTGFKEVYLFGDILWGEYLSPTQELVVTIPQEYAVHPLVEPSSYRVEDGRHLLIWRGPMKIEKEFAVAFTKNPEAARNLEALFKGG